MNIKKATLIAFTSILFSTEVSANLIINELMQSNIDCIKDDLNDFPDSWVELYNSGNTTERLEEYSIGDKDKSSKAYQLPALEIAPGEFIVIYCDKVNEGLHTDFRLDSGKGGSVYLFHNKEIVSKVENWKKQPAPNIAYGRETESNDKWGYQAIPTPGQPNFGNVLKDILSDPIFSTEGKVFTDSFVLTLSVPEDAPQGTFIRYTLDGSEPIETSFLYDEPLSINETTIIRAKLFCDGYLSPRSTTHSYIIHPRAMTLPVISIVSDDKYFYDDKEGILVKGDYTPDIPNYEYDWRRPVNFEYFEQLNNGSLLNQLCETRVKGGGTRKLPLKSMVLYANKRFGTKRFNYEFFPDQTPGISEFKSFELRNSGDDFNTTYMRDAIIQQSMGMNCDLDWQPSRPAIVYINGQYKGILNIRTRSNEDYVYSYYDGLEDIDMIENWHELKEGSKDNFEAFKKFYNEDFHNYSEYENLMDIEEFCNLMIMNIFFDNKDFPANNIVMWRPIEENAKWRWIAKDTDFGLGLYGEPYDYQTLYWITTPGYDNDHNSWANREAYTLLFRRLLEMEEFRNMFIDRCAIYLGDFLSSEEIINRIETRYNELVYEYDFHRKNLGDHHSVFSEKVEEAKEWIGKRVPSFYAQIGSFFNLAQPVQLTVNSRNNNENTLLINGVPLKNQKFSGQFFPGRVLEISTSDALEKEKSYEWRVHVNNNGSVTTNTYFAPVLTIDMPFGEEVEIECIDAGSEVSEIENEFNNSCPIEWYDISGTFIKAQTSLSSAKMPSGMYILRQGNSTKKIFVK